MTNLAENSRPIEVLPTPAGVNPYTAEGCAGVPARLHRVMDTPQRLAEVVRETLFYRGTSIERAAKAAGIATEAAEAVAKDGHGSLADVRALLDALGVIPVSLPSPTELRGKR